MGKENFLTFVLAAGVICFTCSACSTVSTGKTRDGSYKITQTMEISSQLRFDDTPVPSGFSLDRKGSFVFQNDETRMGTMTYIGKTDLGALIKFYKRNMALNGWVLMNSVEFDKVILNFEKDKEGCIVMLEKSGMGKSVITLSLSPLSKAGIAIKEKDKKK
ncbi:MAG: hypothetical protein KJ893_04220 [Candidatus Omnitrophica bacterium]|nr:hypothetical protein [Candidatus Omnitrophota bacterium]MBU4477556.1 hypothetical protein [Candidatus Omnitrophota bacterium]MCG2703584.1 hypothetical protein [Candidatus Omnitrophota bacterium]